MKDASPQPAAFDEYRLLDTPTEEGLDNIVQLASRLLSAPISLLTVVDEQRQWFKARYGWATTETPREWSFCAHALADDQTLIVPDATTDPRFHANPLVVGDPYIRFYCGVPLRTPDGRGLGTLCILDRQAREPTAKEVSVLEGLGRQLELELEIRRRLFMLEERLSAAETQRREKDLLAAMVVHDLRGPLTSISLLASAIDTADPSMRLDLNVLLDEADRARRMLTDVLDICLHEAGALRPRYSDFDLVPLATAVAESQRRVAHLAPGAVQVVAAKSPLKSHADPELIRRVLENLVSNAVQHNVAQAQVQIALATRSDGRLQCEVRDRGSVIPEADRDRVFQALARGPALGAHRGYGLGLTFCRLAVEAHGGRIRVSPNADGRGNCFSFDLPMALPPGGA